MTMRRPHGAAIVLVVAVPAAVWLLIGKLAEGSGTDYIYRVPNLNRHAEVAVGLVVSGVACGVGAILHRNARSWLRDGWWRVYGRVLIAGVAVAVGGRIVTAGSTGANIGGGGILMLGPLPVLYLLEGARVEARRLRTRR
jgi:hypothetical protein